MSSVSTCQTCSGHGATFRTVLTDAPGLTPVMRKRISQGRPAVLAEPCTTCDGQDRITPHLEATAEESA